jgi:3D (Asp-Asp-Asp) domain-containing protein
MWGCGEYPLSTDYTDVPALTGMADLLQREADSKTERSKATRGAVFEPLQPPLIFYTVSSQLEKLDNEHRRSGDRSGGARNPRDHRNNGGARNPRDHRNNGGASLKKPPGLSANANSPAKNRGVKLTLSVFGNNDGEMGNLFADGTRYRKDSIAFASNDFPLGSMVTVETPEGKSLTAKVRDRMNRRFTGKRIDVTVNGWKALTSRGYGLIRGVRVWRVK